MMLRRSVFSSIIMEMMMKNRDKKLEQEVRAAIHDDALIDVEKIEIVVENDLVTLKGSVDSYAKKFAAEHAAKSVKGVKEVMQKIDVRFLFKSNLVVYMGINLVLDGKCLFKNDTNQPMNLIGPLRPDFHIERKCNEMW